MKSALPPIHADPGWKEVKRGRRVHGEWTSESAMFDAFVEVMHALGFRTVPECAGHDLLLVAPPEETLRARHLRGPWAVEPGDVVAVEGKLRPNVELLRQSLPPHRRRSAQWSSRPGSSAADFYAVLVPKWDEDFAEVAAALDIGVVALRAPDPRRTWEMPEDRLHVSVPEWCRVVGHLPLSVPDLDVKMSAGAPSPRTVTPWKIAAVETCLLGLKQDLRPVDFRSPASPRTFVDRGWVQLVRREGRVPVYRLLDVPTRPDLHYPELTDAVLRRLG